ncbi:MAG: DNA polymerase III subunit delta [Thermodesulfovibrionales bacterium]
MSYHEFFKEIEKGLPAPLYLLYASDPFILREAITEVKKLVPFEQKGFNFHLFDFLSTEEKVSLQEIIDVANTAPFFSRRRFVVLTGNLQKFSKNDLKMLDGYLSNPAHYSVFVICHEGILKKDIRERFKGIKVISIDIRGADIPLWVKYRAKSKGIEISDDVVDYLLGTVGTDLGLLSSEIEKLSFIGKKKLSVNDISDIIEGEGFYTPFDLVEALEQKDTEKVFRIYKTLRQTTEAYNIIGILNWLYGRLIRMNRIKKGEEYILKAFEILHNADKDIKNSGRDFPIEYLLLRLLQL